MIAWKPGLLALFAIQVVASPHASASPVEYLYVEANAGSSAGGHFALRLDDWVYDFQNAELGTIRLRRTDYDFFRYLYTVFDNRTMHIARIDVPRESQKSIFDRFNQRYLIENAQFSVLDSLRADRDLIRLLIARSQPAADPASTSESRPSTSSIGDASWASIRAAGFFYDDRGNVAGGRSASVRALRDRLLSDHGQNYLTEQIAALQHAARSLSPSLETISVTAFDGEWRPTTGYHFSDRYRDLCAKILALEVLENAIRILPGARRVPSGNLYELGSEESRQVRVYAERLENDLVKLVASQRPDWGYPLLLGMARLQSLRESLALGRWVVLDSVPANPDFLAQRAVRRRDPFVVELRDRARAEFVEARTHFSTAREPGEPALAWLEEAANRYAAFQRGFEQNLAIPIYGGGRLPERTATARGLPLPHVDLPTLRRAADAAEMRERAYLDAVKRAFGYRLMTKNCVTEIFATVDPAWQSEAARDQRRGVGDPQDLLDFIPGVAYRKVLDANAEVEAIEIPSFRRALLEGMYEAENDLGVYLRESNTLTSTIYRRNDVEPFFLFFTEDALPIRPLYGALNLAAGLGEMALGVLRAPWDRGRTFTSGLKGMAFSFPELFFVNLRKGILEYAPGDQPRTVRRPAQI